MKLIFKSILIIITTLLVFSCDENDDVSTPTNQFTVSGTDYDTPNCYIETNDDHINLFFTDARMYVNDPNQQGSSGDWLFSLNATNLAYFELRFVDNSSLNTNIIPGVYNANSDNTVVGYNLVVNAITPAFFINGTEFGMGDDSQGVWSSGAGTVTVNSYTPASGSILGEINIDYTLGGISGHYEGNWGLMIN
jgi:hypothetical protein